ncbi:hypothetical protein FN846DRAFT_891356 [Sphaerosporella brunnea]|uniref:Uncharacterized protein n=1 Tax=Sphaerosporella brunnea TaxID=1250544 RepID=A0A5J5ETX9_9PEZI|nr:hypothetical protein FN846DRAFT_891356 [Sphaerosporella brunnea]
MVSGDPTRGVEPFLTQEADFFRIDTTKATIPKGWSNNPKDLDLEYYWQGKGDTKQELATDYGLKDASPLITKPPPSGDIYFLFRSSSKYYIWNGIENSVCFIAGPETLEEIFAAMDKFGLEGLRLELLKPNPAPGG